MKIRPEILESISRVIKDYGIAPLEKKRTLPVDLERRRLLEGFLEVNKFVLTNDRLPLENSSISERKLFSRLKGFFFNKENLTILKEHDEDGLLARVVKEFPGWVSLAKEDPVILPADLSSLPKGIRAFSSTSAFKTVMEGKGNVSFGALFGGRFSKPKKQVMPEYVASRKECSDFDQVFKPLFKRCQDDIKNGDRRVVKFRNEQQIEARKFYVLNGLLCYVDKVGEPFKRYGKYNRRLRLIFINGLESDMLLRSLSTELYKGGYMVTELVDDFLDGMKFQPEDRIAGWIYVLKSLSDDPQVSAIPNLYKIGFSTTSVEKRINGADEQTTYLCAPVEVVASFKCANLDIRAMESIIHLVFNSARIEIDVKTPSGDVVRATEWFSIPFDIIKEAIKYIENGTIDNYIYSPADSRLVLK